MAIPMQGGNYSKTGVKILPNPWDRFNFKENFLLMGKKRKKNQQFIRK